MGLIEERFERVKSSRSAQENECFLDEMIRESLKNSTFSKLNLQQ